MKFTKLPEREITLTIKDCGKPRQLTVRIQVDTNPEKALFTYQVVGSQLRIHGMWNKGYDKPYIFKQKNLYCATPEFNKIVALFLRAYKQSFRPVEEANHLEIDYKQYMKTDYKSGTPYWLYVIKKPIKCHGQKVKPYIRRAIIPDEYKAIWNQYREHCKTCSQRATCIGACDAHKKEVI